MNSNMTLLDRIKKHEGFRSHAYLDSKGFLSIGYGTTVGRVYVADAPVKPGDLPLSFQAEGVGITKQQAEWLLQDRVAGIRTELWDRCKAFRDATGVFVGDLFELEDRSAMHHENDISDVLIEMAYQLGVDGLLTEDEYKRVIELVRERASG